MTNPSSSGSELEPCPFCGYKPLPVPQILEGTVGGPWSVWAVCCQLECGERGPRRGTEAEAIAAWNHRALAPAGGSVGVEEAMAALARVEAEVALGAMGHERPEYNGADFDAIRAALRAHVGKPGKGKPVGWFEEEVPGGTALTYRAMGAADDASVIHVYRNPWRPIETAPIDGTPVLVWGRIWSKSYSSKADIDDIANWEPARVWIPEYHIWKTDAGIYECCVHAGFVSGDSARCRPTHWMPLPAPPTPEAEQPE